MSYEIEQISPTRKKLSIEISAEDVEREFKGSLEEIRRQVRVPGFRPGKAPLSLIEKRYGKNIEGEVLEKLITDAYGEALKESALVPVNRPDFEGAPELARGEPLKITMTLEVRPQLENPVYEGLEVKEIPFEVSDDDVDGTLEEVRQNQGSFEPTEEALAEGDMAMVTLYKDGEEVGDQLVRLGSYVPQEIAVALEGRKKGEKAEAEATFAEDFMYEALAGTTSKVDIEIKETKRANLPELDDEFAKDLGFDDLEKLKGHVKEQIHSQKEASVRRMQKAELLKAAIAANDEGLEAPQSLLDSEVQQQSYNVRVSSGQDELGQEQLEQIRTQAERSVKGRMLIEIIGEKENVEVTEDDIRREITDLAARMNLTPENVVKYFMTRDGSLEALKQSLMEDKVLDLMLERAKIEKSTDLEPAEEEA